MVGRLLVCVPRAIPRATPARQVVAGDLVLSDERLSPEREGLDEPVAEELLGGGGDSPEGVTPTAAANEPVGSSHRELVQPHVVTEEEAALDSYSIRDVVLPLPGAAPWPHRIHRPSRQRAPSQPCGPTPGRLASRSRCPHCPTGRLLLRRPADERRYLAAVPGHRIVLPDNKVAVVYHTLLAEHQLSLEVRRCTPLLRDACRVRLGGCLPRPLAREPCPCMRQARRASPATGRWRPEGVWRMAGGFSPSPVAGASHRRLTTGFETLLCLERTAASWNTLEIWPGSSSGTT